VATAMSALLFYLSRERRCYKRLAAEIRSTFQSADEISNGQKLSSCQYLRACIDETLRIAPPVPGTGWRELKSSDSGSLVVDGHVIPPGTQVGVNIYALHHNEEYFPNPYKFEPERWLSSETPEEQRNRMRAAFAPFSIGYRACSGKVMGYLESSLVVAKILWYFDFEIPSGALGKVGGGKPGAEDGREKIGEYQLYDVLSAGHDGPYLMFHPRKGSGDDLLTEGLVFQ
jgi:cytochrome P450